MANGIYNNSLVVIKKDYEVNEIALIKCYALGDHYHNYIIQVETLTYLGNLEVLRS